MTSYKLGEEVQFQEFNRVWHQGTVTGLDLKKKKVQVDFKQHGKWKRLSLSAKRVRRLPVVPAPSIDAQVESQVQEYRKAPWNVDL